MRTTDYNELDLTYTRKMRGVVVDNHDPLGLGRVKVRVYSLHGKDDFDGIPTKDLYWSTVMTPFASYNAGMYLPLEVGTQVFISYENGDSMKPIVEGCFYGQGRSNVQYIGNKDGQMRYQNTNQHEIPKEAMTRDTKVLFKSSKGGKIIFEDTNGYESMKFVDSIGQMIALSSPMKADYSKNNGHLNNSDINSEEFKDYNRMVSPPQVLIKGASGSKMVITSEDKDNSTVELQSKGLKSVFMRLISSGIGLIQTAKSALLIAEKAVSLVLGTKGIQITEDSIIISAPNITLTANNIELTASNVNLNGNVKINGLSIFHVQGCKNCSSNSHIDINEGGPSGSYSPLEDVKELEETREEF